MFFEAAFILLSLALAALFSAKGASFFKLVPYNVVGGIILFVLSRFYAFESLDVFTGIFLAAVFAHAPLGQRGPSPKGILKSNMAFLNYSLLQYCSQWSLGLLLVWLFIKLGASGLRMGFGAVMPAGFSGGYGSAALLGSLFPDFGFENARALLMFSATVGMASALIGGIFFTKLAGRQFTGFSPAEFSLKNKSFVVMPLLLLAAFGMEQIFARALSFEAPLFVFALILSFLLKKPLQKVLPLKEAGKSSSLATDLLVVAGIGSIKFEVVQERAAILTVLFVAGISASFLLFKFLGTKIFKEKSFEKALFTWGWALGGIPVALGLAHSADDSKGESIMSSFSVIYLIIAPFEMALLFSVPWLLMNGYGAALGLGFGLLSLSLIWLLKVQVPEKT